MSEAREDPKVVDYIQAGLDRANEASISRAAKIQVQLVLILVQLVLILHTTKNRKERGEPGKIYHEKHHR